MRRATGRAFWPGHFCFNFYPRSPCGERPGKHAQPPTQQDFYPRSPCGERLQHESADDMYQCISIHALLAESDAVQIVVVIVHALFLSTLSLRRATCYSLRYSASRRYFYPRSPCGERRQWMYHNTRFWIFLSTLSLRRATQWMYHNTRFWIFLSTLSLRRATTGRSVEFHLYAYFYPRSPCGERRSQQQPGTTSTTYFYPRSPCGERLEFRKLLYPGATNFYPRSPCGERPPPYNLIIHQQKISIHALLAESDLEQLIN